MAIQPPNFHVQPLSPANLLAQRPQRPQGQELLSQLLSISRMGPMPDEIEPEAELVEVPEDFTDTFQSPIIQAFLSGYGRF